MKRDDLPEYVDVLDTTDFPAATKPLLPSAQRSRQRYALFVLWVRKTHGWIGLWGAILGLTFGVSGIWLNHRAVLKLPPMAQQRSNAQIALPTTIPATPAEMGHWLTSQLQLGAAPNSTRIEPPKPVPWGDGARQPEHWVFNFGGPDEVIQADYWRGNQSVAVSTISNGILATLTNMHKGVGMSMAWILLVDSLAASLIFLSISGVILWVQMNRRRALGVGIFCASVALTFGLVAQRL